MYDNETVIGEFGFHIMDEAGSKSPGLEVGVGPNIYAGSTKTDDFAVISLGGLLKYRLQSLNRIWFNTALHYAPAVVSFMDAQSLWDFDFRMGYEVVPAASIYWGYRYIHIAFENSGADKDVEKSAFVGLEMNF